MKKKTKYLTSKEWGEKHSIFLRRVQQLFRDNRIAGAIRPQRDILIPEDSPDPRKPRGRPELSAETIKRIKKE